MVIPYSSKNIAAIVLAGGLGKRFGEPKQFFKVLGKPVLFHTVDSLLSFKIARIIILIVPEKKIDFVKKHYAAFSQIVVISGGETRYESTRKGIEYLSQQSDFEFVYVHDGVRPFVTKQIFLCLYRTLTKENSHGAVSYLPVNDSLIYLKKGNKNQYFDKEKIISTQTPHLYRLDSLKKCFFECKVELENAQMMEKAGRKLSYVLGSRENIKLTYPADLPFFKKMLSV